MFYFPQNRSFELMGVVERARPPSAFHILKELSIQAYVKFSNFESYA